MAVRPLEVAVLLLLGLGATAVHGSPISSCPHGWTEGIRTSNSATTCLKYLARHKTWSQAKASCKREGASLVEIGSAEENDKVKSLMSHGAATWLGLTRNLRSGDFEWQSQPERPLMYEDWLPNQPDNWPYDTLGQQNCGYTYSRGGWDDSACDHRHGYVCQLLTQRRSPVTQRPSPVTQPPSPVTQRPSPDCSTAKLVSRFHVPYNTLPSDILNGRTVRSGGHSGVYQFTCNNGVWNKDKKVSGCAGGAAGSVALRRRATFGTTHIDQNTLYRQGQIFVAQTGYQIIVTWTCGSHGRWSSHTWSGE